MNVDGAVTGVIVSYNGGKILKTAINSIRKFHPAMNLIIVDGSDVNDGCYKYIQTLPDQYTKVYHVSRNIGHGRGLVLGISYVQTPFFLTIDSDIEMLKSPLQDMLDMMEDDTCVVGYVENIDREGNDYGARPDLMQYGHFKYVHPYFSLYQMKEYRKYKPFCHHGAPAVNVMLDIARKGMSDKVIKEFPGLGHSGGQPINNAGNWKAKPREFIKHDRDGTRVSIEGGWERTIDPFQKIITCLTPTGDRTGPFSLARIWMARQTVQPDQWLVIDDGFTPMPMELREGLDYIRRKPTSGEGHTLVKNMKFALPHIKGDVILIIEDDDWYGDKYIEMMCEHLKSHDLVGEGCSRYYHVSAMKYVRLQNREHTSLCQTGFNRILLPMFEQALDGDPYIDMRFWLDKARNYGFLFYDTNDALKLHCSLKGLNGRPGIGTGHNRKENYYRQDSGYKMLKRWVGEENCQIYLNHVGTIPRAVTVTKPSTPPTMKHKHLIG